MIEHFFKDKAIRGDVEAFLINKKGKRRRVLDKKNLILTNAKTIITHLLAGGNQIIDYISAYNSTVILSSAPITNYTFPNSAAVQFTAIFTDTSFGGIIDQLNLTSSIGGDFSELSLLNINKPTGYQLQIIWTITFVDCIPNPSFMVIDFVTTNGQTTYTNTLLIGKTILIHFYDHNRLDDPNSPNPDFSFNNSTGEITYSNVTYPLGLTGGIQASIVYSN